MTWQRNRDAPIADEEVRKLARRYRPESIATLIAVCRDERAPASARVSAASKLLEYSDGKPGQAKPVTVADVAAMSDEQRQQLLDALLGHYAPGGFRALLAQSCDEAVRKYQQTLAAHRPKRFQRGGGSPPSRFQRDAMPALPAPLTSPASARSQPLSRESAMAAVDGHANASGNGRALTRVTGEVANS